MAEKKLTTILEILKYSANLLSENGIKDARLNVELMFCDILKCERMKLYLDFDKPLSQDEIAEFKVMLKRRLKKEPLQYILGKTNFYGYEIELNNKVLIPRQETEILVDKVLEDIINSGIVSVNILEIGSGSGCIAIALASELKKKDISFKLISIDKSEDAILLARKNAEKNNLNDLEFINEDYFNFKTTDNFDYIVSNPPYIPLKDIDTLDDEVKNYEPIESLTDGGEGLKFYEKILVDFSGKSKIFTELGDGQSKKIEELLVKNGIKDYNIFKDYCNIDRVLAV